MGKNTTTKNEEPDLKVHLKPVLGIKPGLYLTVLYSIILLIFLLGIFQISGLFRNGSRVSIQTLPGGVSVYANGKWLGSTPITSFVDKGEVDFLFKKDNFEDLTINSEVKGSLNIQENLRLKDINKLTEKAYVDLSQWSMTDTSSKQYQSPPILSDTIDSIVHRNAELNESDLLKMETFLKESMKNISSPSMMQDLIKASTLKSSKGYMYNSSALIQNIINFSQIIDDSPSSIFWLMNNSGENIQKELKHQTWFIKKISDFDVNIQNFQPNYARKIDYISLRGINYVGFSNSSYISGNANGTDNLIPDIKTLSPYYIQTTEVTNEQYYQFIKNNKKWDMANKNDLVREGLVVDNYLRSWENGKYKEEEKDYPVSFISRTAAEAYCEWLSLSLYRDFINWKVQLPTESQWEMASIVDDNWTKSEKSENKLESVKKLDSGKAGLYGMNGNVWEWTDDYFSVYMNYFKDDLSEFNDTGTAIVKGGSWANQPEEINIFTRGSQPVEWCTPYLGFRTVLVEKD